MGHRGCGTGTDRKRRIRDNLKLAGDIDINGCLWDQLGALDCEKMFFASSTKLFYLFKKMAFESEKAVFERVRLFLLWR